MNLYGFLCAGVNADSTPFCCEWSLLGRDTGAGDTGEAGGGVEVEAFGGVGEVGGVGGVGDNDGDEKKSFRMLSRPDVVSTRANAPCNLRKTAREISVLAVTP